MFAGKTHANLVQLQSDIEAQLQSGEAADPEYWTAILNRLRTHKAKAKLREVHRDLLQQHLDRTQHLQDTVNVAQEMGWDDKDKVCSCYSWQLTCITHMTCSLSQVSSEPSEAALPDRCLLLT